MGLVEDLLLTLDKKRPRPRSVRPNPYLEGNFAPVGREGDFPSLSVLSGEVPRELRGTLYRMSPGPRFEPPNPDLYHWFDGDGMIDAFVIEDGRVSQKNRWVRTEKWRLEDRAGRALYGGLRDLARSTTIEGWLALGFSGQELVGLQAQAMLGKGPSPEQLERILRAVDRSNTSIQRMAGRLLTLVEGSAAHEIDPVTLETRGSFDFGGAIQAGKGGMVAHPKIEPGTETVYTFGYWGGRGGLSYHVLGKDGALRLSRDIEAPFPAMMHDFSVTETRAVFYHLPAVLRMDDLESPNTVRWQPSRGARIGVVLRDDPHAPVRWYEIPPCFVFHPMNAYDDGHAVVLDIVRYPRLPLFDPGGETMNPGIEEYPPGLLVRLRLDLDTGAITETVLDDAPCEFPVVDGRFAMRRHRYGWVAARLWPNCGRGIMNAIGRVDFQTGEVRYRNLGRSTYTNEPLFLPRAKDAPEGDGYLITTVYHADEGESDLLILDAMDLDAEPVAVVRARQRVPYGFHGTWIPGAG
ncbi:carotenoid oxygenase family protein [Polyangium spumosum]|uniref:9-cis-epoxycarotenoid dioxygenase n=1 Tax=Polyangium spumosum TaxID=889282 RepID=A0A6N7PWD0_9BACT|nr:carotenoid oxygenase family protein [Polyangium spumosum]MRG94394.1 9-cis-epoxycarotenoid dioxygenase [Polyangium spumosum]